jgi:tetratricopeptide (TPR) repeat protein
MRFILTAAFLCVTFTGTFSQELQKIDSLHNELIMEKEDTIRVRLLNELSNEHSYGDKDKALQYANQALKLSTEIQYAGGRANSLDRLASVHYQYGEWQLALSKFLEAIQIYQNLGDTKSIANGYYYVGVVHFKQGAYQQVMENLEKANSIYREIGDKAGLAGSLNLMGWVHNYQGDAAKAVSDFEEALLMAKESGNDGDRRTRPSVISRNHMPCQLNWMTSST